MQYRSTIGTVYTLHVRFTLSRYFIQNIFRHNRFRLRNKHTARVHNVFVFFTR